MDTIFAVSSGAPPAAIAVLRVSGSRALAAAEAMAGRLPSPRTAGLRALRDPATGALLDRALMLVFPGPESATGEDLVELHLHGGRAVVRAVEATLAATPGLRAAEAGEFTRRALIAGRIDLTEAEGLADLLAAETEGQRRAAILNTEGGLRARVEDWATRTLALAAALEAVIDHGDEEDAADEAAIVASARAGAGALADEIGVILAQPPIERLGDGIRVVLAGPPNSGKSSLINAMSDREAAIVSPIAGTTRDRIEAPVTRDGIAWLLTDTAGLAETSDDPIELIGINRAREAMARADIILWLGDGAPPVGDAVIALHARCDLSGREAVPSGRIAVSTKRLGGLDTLWQALAERAAAILPVADLPALNARQRDLCCNAQNSLRDAAASSDPLLAAESLRSARVAFDAITGKAGTEHVLDALFARFCIGK